MTTVLVDGKIILRARVLLTDAVAQDAGDMAKIAAAVFEYEPLLEATAKANGGQ